MADTPQTSTATPQTSGHQNNEKKPDFFGGTDSVFDNLEKFERISNPTGEDQNFDFEFENSEVEPSASSDQQFTDEELSVGDVVVDDKTQDLSWASVSEEVLLEKDTSSLASHPVDVQEQSEAYWSKEQWWSETSVPTAQSQIETSDTQSEITQMSDSHENIISEDSSSTDITWDKEEIAEEQVLTSEESDAQTIEKEPSHQESVLMQTYQTLYQQARRVLKLERKIQKTEQVHFELQGEGDIKYIVSFWNVAEMLLSLEKVEKDSRHLLSFAPQTEGKNLCVTVDDTLLYEEEKDLQDQSKLIQVSDKLEKFRLLFDAKEAGLEEQWKTLKAEREKIRICRDIFRRF